MSENPRISIIIPAYNEEQSLPKVIHDIPQSLIDEIIVVDNGSSDNTSHVAGDLGCRVISEQRKGYGQACQAGMAALKADTDIVVFLDADYSDHPDELPALIAPIIAEDYDFVVGSRIAGEHARNALLPQALFGNKLACFLIKHFWGYTFTDLGPFRAIRKQSLDRLHMQDTNFGWTVEMQVKALQHKLNICEVPVSYRQRIGQSKITGTVSGAIRAGYKILTTIFYYKYFVKKETGTL